MEKILHVLSGDGMRVAFDKANLKGDVLVWKECFYEGPVPAGFDRDFWNARSNYLDLAYEEYGSDKAPYENWHTQTLPAALQSDPKEILLWFGYGLFCQINLMGALAWLQSRNVAARIAIVYPGEGEDPLLPEKYTPDQMQIFYDKKVILSETDLEFADRFWASYTQASPEHLFALSDKIPPAFPFLFQALHAHFYLFPSLYNGLNRIEEILLRYIEMALPASMETMIKGFAEFGYAYGLNNFQVIGHLKKISPLLITFNGQDINSFTPSQQMGFKGEITLTQLAVDVLCHQKNWLNFHDFHEWRGGILLSKRTNMHFWDPLEFCFV